MSKLTDRFPRYSRLLSLYPAPYRRRYALSMLQTLADMLDDPQANHRLVWLRVATDLPLSLAHQQIIYCSDVMARETPSYVKTTSAISGLMLMPFLLSVAANSLVPGHLYHSWLWQFRPLIVWVLILPALAAALCAVIFSIWATQRHRAGISVWRSAFDLPRNWPLLAPLAAGLFIVALVLFHDTVHCVSGNPLAEISHWHQTWRCIAQR